MVERWVGCKYCCHLIVVRRMYVFINTVACELHLPGDGRMRHVIGLSRVGARGENTGENTDQGCHRLTSCRDRTLLSPCSSNLSPSAKMEKSSSLQNSELCP